MPQYIFKKTNNNNNISHLLHKLLFNQFMTI